jgi:hypothetical protein
MTAVECSSSSRLLQRALVSRYRVPWSQERSDQAGRFRVSDMRGVVKKIQEFFDVDSSLHHEFVPPGQSGTGHFYVQVLQRMRDAVRRKRRNKVAGTVVSASRQRAEPHRACCVITKPPCSPNLAPGDFWLFHTLKIWHASQPWRTSNRMRGRTPEDSGLQPVLPTTAGSMEQACVCVCVCVCVRSRVLLWRWLGKSSLCPTTTVQYHHSGNFLTAHRLIDRYPTPISIGTLNILDEI